MKRILIWVVVPVSLAFVTLMGIAVVLTLQVFASATSLALSPDTVLLALSGGKSINVAVYFEGKREDHPVPALAGSSAGYSRGYGYSAAGQSVHVQIDESYKVISDSPGHFQITVHRAIETNGAKTASDYTLPVWKIEPSADKRIKLPDGSSAVAYLGTGSH